MQAKKFRPAGLRSGHGTQNFSGAVHFACRRGPKAAAIINGPRLMFEHSYNHSNYNSSSSSTTITTDSNYKAVGVMNTTNYNRFKLLMQRINEHNKYTITTVGVMNNSSTTVLNSTKTDG
jgi:hypothetical protein